MPTATQAPASGAGAPGEADSRPPVSPRRRRAGRLAMLALLLLAWDIVPGGPPALWNLLTPVQASLLQYAETVPDGLGPPFGILFALGAAIVPWARFGVRFALGLLLLMVLAALSRFVATRFGAMLRSQTAMAFVRMVLVMAVALPAALIVDAMLLCMFGTVVQLGTIAGSLLWNLVDAIASTHVATTTLLFGMEHPGPGAFARLTLWGQYTLVGGLAYAARTWSRGEPPFPVTVFWYEYLVDGYLFPPRQRKRAGSAPRSA